MVSNHHISNWITQTAAFHQDENTLNKWKRGVRAPLFQVCTLIHYSGNN